jgi:hypothetical protein
MSYIDDDVQEGRRCASVITAQAAQLSSCTAGEDCELCRALEEFSHKLNILAADLLESAEAYAVSENAELEGNGG